MKRELVGDGLWLINDCSVGLATPVVAGGEGTLCLFFGGQGFRLEDEEDEKWAREVVECFHALSKRLERDGYTCG